MTGTSASTINGSISANGQVWLLNPNGLLFGNGATINVGGLLATTSDITDQNFLSGAYSFTSAGGNGGVTNNGTITAGKAGSVVLSSPSVVNTGIIRANTGHVVLGGTDTFTVDFTGDHLLNYAISANSAGGKVLNSGKIAAAGGSVLMTARAAQGVQDAVVNNTGMVEANSVRQENGEIILEADNGTVSNSGTLNASGTGAGQTGGTVKILGQQVAVADGAVINVSGNAGGGTALIGGNLHGAGPEPNAQNTMVGKARINANAITSGKGGTVAIYSTGSTSVAAAITATGGAKSGDGGMVETSGHLLSIADNTTVSTLAPMGKAGDWLLDPDDIIIATGGGGSTSGETFGVTGTVTIDPTTIATAVASGNVDLQANQDITVNNAVSASSAGNALYLEAGRSIILNAGLQNTGGMIALYAGDPGATGGTQTGATISGSGVLSSGIIQLSLGATGSIGTAGTPIIIDSAQSGGQLALGVQSLGADAYIATASGTVAGEVVVYNTGTAFAQGIGNHPGVNLTSAVAGTLTGSTTVGSFTLASSIPIIQGWTVTAQNVTITATGTASISLNDIGNPSFGDAGNQIAGAVNFTTANGNVSYGNSISTGTTITGTDSINGSYTIVSGQYGPPVASTPTTTYYPLTIGAPTSAAGTVSLTALSIVQDTGATITSGGLTASAQGASSGITMTQSGNDIGGTVRFTTVGGNVNFTNAASTTTLGGSNIVGDLTVIAGNTLDLTDTTGTLSANNVSLTAANFIDQAFFGASLPIVTGNFSATATNSTGSLRLLPASGPGNAVTGTVTLTGGTAGGIGFSNSDTINLAAIGPVADMTITSTGATSDIDINGTLQASDSFGISLNAGGNINFGTGSGLIASTVSLTSGSGIGGSFPNAIPVSATSGAVSLSVSAGPSNSAYITSTSPVTVTSASLSGGTFDLETTGAASNITVTGAISTNGSGSSIYLASQGSLILNANLVATDGTVFLNANSNFAANSPASITGAGTVSATDVAIQLGGLNNTGTGSIGTPGSPLLLALSTLDGVTALGLEVGTSGQNVFLSSQSSVNISNVDGTLGIQGVNLTGATPVGNFTLSAAGQITQASGITASNLSVTTTGAGNAITLNDSNTSTGNMLNGTVRFHSAGDVTFNNEYNNPTTLGSSVANGTMTINADNSALYLIDGSDTSGVVVNSSAGAMGAGTLVLSALGDVAQGITNNHVVTDDTNAIPIIANTLNVSVGDAAILLTENTATLRNGISGYSSGYSNTMGANLGASTVGGNLVVVSSNGDLDVQDPSGGTVQVTGTATLSASGSGLGISIQSPVTSGTSLTLIANQNISQSSGGGADLLAGSVLYAQSTAGSISLTDPANQVGGIALLSAGGNVVLQTATSLTLGNVTASNGGKIKIVSGGNLTIESGSMLTSSQASGYSIQLAAAGNFINEQGANALSMPSGANFAIFSAAPGGDVFGGLNSGDTPIWGMSFVASAGQTTVTGNRYIFASQPTLTVSASNASKVYGVNDATSLQTGYTVSGLQAGLSGVYLADTVASVFGSTPVAVSTGSAATAGVGSYAITLSGITPLDGYAIATQNGTLTISPATLTYAANAASRAAGNLSPAFSGTVTGFVNSDTQASSTIGTLSFVSTATADSTAGSYAINGSGLTATNYVFVQAAGNATALTIGGSSQSQINGSTPVLTGFTAGLQPPLLNPANTPLGVLPFNLIALPVVPPPPPPPVAPPPPVPSPLADNNNEHPTSSDQTTTQVADSLNGNGPPPGSHGGGVVIPTMLVNARPPVPPPTDITALSSFGNSSLWQ